MTHVTTPHDDALVITSEVNGFQMRMVSVDGGSLTNIMFLKEFEKLGKSKKDLKNVDFPLIRFVGCLIYNLSVVKLLVFLGEWWKSIHIDVLFIVVDALSTYNPIFRWTTINTYNNFASTIHQKMKFMIPRGMGKAWGDQLLLM